MATETHGAEEGGLVFHPMDQFKIEPAFGDGAIGMFTVTNATVWMALAVVANLCTAGSGQLQTGDDPLADAVGC